MHEGTQIAFVNCKYPGESHTVYKNQALFSLNVIPYFAPKDVKNFSIIEECFLLGLKKFGFHEFQYKGAKLARNYQHNYIAHKHCHLTPST